jgi:hypothetical protein
MASDHVYVGVRGEPGRPVALFDGDSLVMQSTMRVDGVFDFIAVRLSQGPHHLRVRLLNSLNITRWDSIAVHVAGLPASRCQRPTIRCRRTATRSTVCVRVPIAGAFLALAASSLP